MKIFLSLLLFLTSCFDIGSLCTNADYVYVNGRCVARPKPPDMNETTPDMPTDMSMTPMVDMYMDMTMPPNPMTDDCFKAYFPTYPASGSSITPKNFVPPVPTGGECRPAKCVDSNPISCNGRKVMKRNCKTDATIIQWTDTTDPNKWYVSVNISGNTVYEYVYIGASKVCERGVDVPCIFEFELYWCDFVN